MMDSTQGFRRRKVTSNVMLGLCGGAAALSVSVLLMVIGYTLVNGLAYLNIAFLTETARPLGEPGGGMRNEIIGTLVLVSLASVMGLPVGLMAGAYLAEFGNDRLGVAIRTVADMMTGTPSVVVGIFVYVMVVRPMGSFSALSGGIALAVIMLPVVARTTEEMMRLVPRSYRESALALGIPAWRVTLSIVMPGALAGIVTGAMLAVARISGETAPLIFTALGNRFGYAGLDQPVAALSLQIWRYAVSAYDSWHQQAWAASFLLVMLVMIVSIAVRVVTARQYH